MLTQIPPAEKHEDLPYGSFWSAGVLKLHYFVAQRLYTHGSGITIPHCYCNHHSSTIPQDEEWRALLLVS